MFRFIIYLNPYIPKISDWIGRTISWCSLLMVVLVFVIAVMRYVFKIGSIPMQELVIYLHGFLFMLTAGYTLAKDEHVRVDVFYSKMSKRNQAIVNLVGCIIFLMPICWFIFSNSWDYVVMSWRVSESSSETGGLPFLFVLKALLIIMPSLLALQGLHLILNSISTLLEDQKNA